MSTATWSARWSKCSRSAGTGSLVPGRRRAARSICAVSLLPTGTGASTGWGRAPRVALAWQEWLAGIGEAGAAADAAACADATPLGASMELPGPVGERNTYTLEPRGAVLCVASDERALWRQISATLCTGNRALYQPAYVVTSLAQSRVQIEAMRSGMAMSLFQASQQASTMSS